MNTVDKIRKQLEDKFIELRLAKDQFLTIERKVEFLEGDIMNLQQDLDELLEIEDRYKD